ncbi:MAG TPA: sigma-70 family RNA polymerase sigma factor [Gammaproteobacteria bacterium]|nr:sigma-70 family RNA polymerase sigma factor [Gammaproteobacteria bacterium]
MSAKKTTKPILSNIAYHSSTQTFSLLLLKNELRLAKKIERHYKKILWLATQCPDALDVLHTHFYQITQGKLKLNTFVCDSLFDKHNSMPNLKIIQTKMINLSVLQSLLKEQMQNFGKRDKRTLATRKYLAEYLNTFKWTSTMIECLVQAIHAFPNDLDTLKNRSLKSKLHLAFESFNAGKKALFEESLRLVFCIAKKYHSKGLDYSDLIQEGNIGLKKAIERFEYRFGYSFADYATWWIKYNILSFISKHKFGITLPSHQKDQAIATPVDFVSAKHLSQITNEALSQLSTQEAEILKKRLGIGTNSAAMVEEITTHFNTSKEDLRRIEAKALKALLRQQSFGQ